MLSLADAVRALLLLILANSLPWISARLLGRRWTAPLDLGVTLRDGRRLLGSHKTWRGIIAAACGCALAAALAHLHWRTGAEFAALSLLGDALSSLCKRRLGIKPGVDVALLDQLPEALLPLIALRGPLGLGSVGIAAVAAVFALLDMLASPARRCGAPSALRDMRG
ncbi:MAG TPA: CDP-archaeol synthase [Steroidobacteraceae bacterium]|nr:CDP-archaeol synthase [Steroidobacteraceae bacterium]